MTNANQSLLSDTKEHRRAISVVQDAFDGLTTGAKKPRFITEETMLVLSRKIRERLLIGDSITVTVTRVRGKTVTLGIEAPPDVSIKREKPVEREKERRVA